jgi:HSP20 family protein
VAFARWDPVSDLLAIHQRLDRLTAGQADWRPRVDLHETPDEYVLTAELPGLSTADIDVRFEDGRLTLSGTRQEAERVCEQYHRVERGHGRFNRSFQLPHPIDSGAIGADMRDGVLTVRCPKSSDTGPRRIRIS